MKQMALFVLIAFLTGIAVGLVSGLTIGNDTCKKELTYDKQ